MPSAAKKLAAIFGATGKLEASYGAGGSLVLATDSILLMEEANLSEEYINTGERPPGIGRGGPMKRVAASGRGGSVELPVEAMGLTSAYSASAFPPNGQHFLNRIAGLAATYSASPTPQWTYIPETIAPLMPSGVMDLYAHGEVWPYTGVVASMGFAIEGAGMMVLRYPTFGIPGTFAEQPTVPDLIVIGTAPPTATGIALTIGAFNVPVVRSVTFSMNREISPNRLDHVASDGSAGYVGGSRAATLSLEVEAAPLAATSTPTTTTMDPYKMMREATHVPITFTVGSAQYNRITFTSANCALQNVVTKGADGPVAMWTLVFGCYQSSFGTRDDFELKYN